MNSPEIYLDVLIIDDGYNRKSRIEKVKAAREEKQVVLSEFL